MGTFRAIIRKLGLRPRAKEGNVAETFEIFDVCSNVSSFADLWKYCCGSKICFPGSTKCFSENSEIFFAFRLRFPLFIYKERSRYRFDKQIRIMSRDTLQKTRTYLSVGLIVHLILMFKTVVKSNQICPRATVWDRGTSQVTNCKHLEEQIGSLPSSGMSIEQPDRLSLRPSMPLKNDTFLNIGLSF